MKILYSLALVVVLANLTEAAYNEGYWSVLISGFLLVVFTRELRLELTDWFKEGEGVATDQPIEPD